MVISALYIPETWVTTPGVRGVAIHSCRHSAPFVMVRLLFSLFVLIVLASVLTPMVAANTALGADEASVVVKLAELFPVLSLLPSFARQDSGIGKPWPQDLSTYCPMGTVGWGFYGLHCDGTGHIDQISMYVPHTSLPLIASHRARFDAALDPIAPF